MKKTRLLLVDDQVLFVESLKRVLESLSKNLEVVAIAHDGEEAVELASEFKPDIILMDVRMPNMDGVEATQLILNRDDSIHIIMLTTFDDDEYVFQAIRYGAVGYILKDIPPEELVRLLAAATNGSMLLSHGIAERLVAEARHNITQIPPNPEVENTSIISALSKREIDVLHCIVQGKSNKQIADRLFLSEQTVRNYVSTIYSKLGEKNRYNLIQKLKNGFST